MDFQNVQASKYCQKWKLKSIKLHNLQTPLNQIINMEPYIFLLSFVTIAKVKICFQNTIQGSDK